MNVHSPHLTPGAGRFFLTQHAFEPVLKRHAESLGARISFGHEVVSLQEHASGVDVLVRNLGTEGGQENQRGRIKRYRAQYVVAADGHRSAIHSALGIQMRGHGILSSSLTIYFRAEMWDIVHSTEWGKHSVTNGVIYVSNDLVRGFFRLDRHLKGGFLVVNTYGPRGAERSRSLDPNITKEEAEKVLRSAIGVHTTTPITIDLIAPWKAVSDNASSYASPGGRIFLAGDAAHTVPPTGGFGGNTGLADAHNFAWKAAMIIKGQAGHGLLASYDAERRPVGHFTVEQAYARYVNRIAPELSVSGPAPERPDYEIEVRAL